MIIFELISYISIFYIFSYTFLLLVLALLGLILNPNKADFFKFYKISKLGILFQLYILVYFFIIFLQHNIFLQNNCVCSVYSIDNYFFIDNFLFKTIFLSFFLYFVCLIYTFFSLDSQKYFFKFDYIICLGILVLTTITAVTSQNFLIFFLHVEVCSFLIYILIAKNPYAISVIQASVEYFLMNSIASIAMLTGIFFYYFLYGTLNMSEINILMEYLSLENKIYAYFASIFYFSGLLYKLGIFPIFFFLIKVHATPTWSLITWLNLFPKIQIFIFLIYYFKFFLEISFFIFSMVILNLILAPIFAIGTFNLKRILILSSAINLSLGLLPYMYFNIIALNISFVYIFFYSISFLSVIGIFILLETSIVSKTYLILTVYDLLFIAKSFPLHMGLLFLNLLNFSGLPPLSFFFFKFLIFFQQSFLFNFTIFFIIFFSSILFLYIYLTVIKLIILEVKIFCNWIFFVNINFYFNYVLILMTFFSVFFFQIFELNIFF